MLKSSQNLSWVYPTFSGWTKCQYCGNIYSVEKIKEHEAICGTRTRPIKPSIKDAVEQALRAYPSCDKATLVRLVWQIRDGYITPLPVSKLTDPWTIVRYYYDMKRKRI